ncbi:MAG: glycosyltransferase, partial [Verrucomicrobia bacterium]|nr:glycosyltransferase [Verrucomicrobiota bacterium]
MISVVIPTYNRAQFLAETIESVLAQVYREFEVIVIDDGSTDNTAEVVARFGDKVRYVPQPNSERAVSRNHGLRLATGEFLAFLDSDDCWEKQALIEMVKSLRANPAAAFTAVSCSIVGADSRVLSVFYPGGGVEGVLPHAFHQLLRTNVVGSPSAVLLRRSVLERWGSFDENRGLLGVEDWELWARLAFHAPIVCRRWPLVRYRRHFSNTPLAAMRLRYPSLAEALLRNLSLT